MDGSRRRFRWGGSVANGVPGVCPATRLLGCLGLVASLILLSAVLPSVASAAECTDTWTGPATGSWATSGSWSGGHVPTESDVACIGSGKTVETTTMSYAGAVQGEGMLKLSGGLTVSGVAAPSPIRTLILNGGELSGAGEVRISESLQWIKESIMTGTGSVVIEPGATATATPTGYMYVIKGHRLVNKGTFTMSSGKFKVYGGATIENIGTFNANAEGSFTFGTEGPPFGSVINRGTFRKAAGTGITAESVWFENEGLVDVESGELTFSGGGKSGALSEWRTASGGPRLYIGSPTTPYSLGGGVMSGAVTLSGSVEMQGVDAESASVKVEGATLTIPTGVQKLHTVAIGASSLIPTIGGKGDLEIEGSLAIERSFIMTGTGSTVIGPGATASTVAGPTTLTEGRRLLNEGTFTMSNGSFKLVNGARIENVGIFNANAESESAFTTEGTVLGSVINRGIFQKTAGTGTTGVKPPFYNYGSIPTLSGHLKIENPVRGAATEHTPHHSSCGDPVDCATGNFTETQTDFEIGGRGVGLDLARTYSALAAAGGSLGIFGYGWTNSFGDKLASGESGAKETLTEASGGTVTFTKSGASWVAPSWSQDIVTGSAESGFTLTLPDQTEEKFNGSGRLESVTDRNGNETALAYSGFGKLEAITDPTGRKITLTYNAEGLVEKAKDPMGHEVKYTYEGKNLKWVTLPGETSASWQFKYDASHRMTSMTDGRGGKTTNEYDSSSRVIAQTDPAERKTTWEYGPFHTKVTNKATGAVTDEWFNSYNQPYSVTHGFGTASATTETFTYTAVGFLASKADGNGHTTTFSYDAEGNRTSERDAEGDEVNWTYNEVHQVLSETKPSGEKTTIVRDPNGNPETVSRPAPEAKTQSVSYKYGPHGELEFMTDPLGNVWSYEYDSHGDLKAEADPEGDMRSWAYDGGSRVISATSPRGNEEGAEVAKYTTSIERDGQGRSLKITDPLEGTTKYAYDANGNVESITDPNGRKTKFSYDPDNEPTRVEQPNGAIEETGYDGAGEVISQNDGNKQKTTYVRNALEQPVEVLDPLERKTTETFDAAGNLKTKTDPDGRTTTYVYDNANMLKEVSYSDGLTPKATFAYDKDGDITIMVDGTGESMFEYDQLDRLVHSEDGHGDTVSWEYNLGNEPIGLTYPNGKSISRLYDKAGRLESVTDWLGNTTSFSYNRDSGLKATTFPVGTGNTDEYAFDRADRMSAVTMKQGAETLASLSYARDKAGQVESLISNGLPGAEEEPLAYDENERLKSAGARSYEYDAADNLTKAPGTTNAFDKASELESATGATFTYDKEGERSKQAPSGGPATTYEYDQAGNLTAVERPEEGETPPIAESFGYDGTGLLASRTVGLGVQHFIWDSSEALPLLLCDGESSNVYGPNGLAVEQISAEEEPTYLHHDQLGSTRLLTDAEGETSATFSYTPYGALEGKTGSATTPLGFAGQYTDAGSGLQYLRARFYDPATAQFLTKDPINELTGNPYSYARSNPLRFVDPSGKACVEQFRIGGFSMGVYPNAIDCFGQGAKEVLASPVTGPVAGLLCAVAPGCGLFEAVAGGVFFGTVSNVLRAEQNPCFEFAPHEIAGLLILLAGSLPGGLLEGVPGSSGGLSPVGRRALEISQDAPGLFLEFIHALQEK